MGFFFNLLTGAARGYSRVTGCGPALQPEPARKTSSEYFYDMGYMDGAGVGGQEEFLEAPEQVPEAYRKDWWAGYHAGCKRRQEET